MSLKENSSSVPRVVPLTLLAARLTFLSVPLPPPQGMLAKAMIVEGVAVGAMTVLFALALDRVAAAARIVEPVAGAAAVFGDGDHAVQRGGADPHLDGHVPGVVDELKVRAAAVIGDHGLAAVGHVVLLEAGAVGGELGEFDLFFQPQKRQVQRGGHLGHAAAGDVDAPGVLRGHITVGLGAGSHSGVEREAPAGVHPRAVDGRGGALDVPPVVAAGVLQRRAGGVARLRQRRRHGQRADDQCQYQNPRSDSLFHGDQRLLFQWLCAFDGKHSQYVPFRKLFWKNGKNATIRR